MTAHQPRTRVVQVTVTAEACKVRMYWERWYHSGTARRAGQMTAIVVGTTGIEPTDDDLTRYAYAMAYWVIDPRRRHLRPMPFKTWKQVALGDDTTSPHGEDVDGRQMEMDALPLDGGWTEAPQPSTIKTRRLAQGSSAAKRLRSSPSAPVIRNLATRKTEQVDGA
jgi:hypothetical protein